MTKNRWIWVGILITTLLTGCGDKRELSELGIIGAVAYDTADDQTKVSMNILQQDGEKTTVLNGTGPSCQEAYEDANEKLPRQMYPSHIRVHVFGEAYARKGLEEISELVLRDQAFRIDVPMLVVQGDAADTALRSMAKQGSMESENLYRLLHENAALGRTVETSVLEFIKQTGTTGIQPLVGCIKVEQTEEETIEVSCSGAAVFSGNQLIGYLTEQQTLACQLVRGTPIRASLYLNESGASVEIENKKTKMLVDEQQAEVFIALEVSVIGKKNTMDIETILRETQKEVQQTVFQTVQEVQHQYGIDIFGFGKTMRDMGTEQWNQLFAQLPVHVRVETTLKSAGQVVK